MATTPFSDEFTNRLRTPTAWRFEATLGQVFTPRFFCCTDPNDLGLAEGKNPVAVIELSPNPALVGESVSFDGSNSYDPDGSIVGYEWTFESASTLSSASASGTNSWLTPGSYEVSLVVEDGTGLKSAPARVIIEVAEPVGAYFIGTSTGVYFTQDGGENFVAKNDGLTGDALTVNDVKIDPWTQHLPHGQKTVWIATGDGVYASNDGGDSWTKKSDDVTVPNDFGDSPAPMGDDLTFESLLFVGNTILTIARWTNGSGLERSWVFYAVGSAGGVSGVRGDISAELSWLAI